LETLATLRAKNPLARIDLCFSRDSVEVRCYDCPEKKFPISEFNTGWKSIETHLNSKRHADHVGQNRSRVISISASKGLRLGNVPSTASNPNTIAPAPPSSNTLVNNISPSTTTSDQLVTIHQHNRLDADHAKLSHDHKKLQTDVASLQKTTQEISETVSTIYRKQSVTDTNLKSLSENSIPQLSITSSV